MKKATKTALISLLSVLVVMAMMIAMTGCNSSDDNTAETKATTATEIATQAQTEKATTASTEAPKETTAPTQAEEQDNQDSNTELTIADVRGTWVSENAPQNCSVEVVNKAGNTIDIVITASKEGATKIATAKASLDIICNGDLVDENGFSDGTGTFEYKDSFDNTGTGTIYVSSSVIRISLTEDYNSGSGWGIAPAANGKYVFYSNEVHSSF